MKRKLLLLLLIPIVAAGAWISSWQSVGNALQRSNDAANFRTDLGSGRGFAYWYQKGQIDSLFLNVPTQLITDSSSKPATTAWIYRYLLANQVYFSSQYFYGTGSFSTQYKVGNSDSLGHHAPSYYLTYGNIIGTPTSLPPNGAAGGDLSGTYPNPTVARLNGQPGSYYLTYSNLSGTPTDLSSFTNGPGYALINGTNTLRTAANFGQTASEADVGHYTVPAGPANTYDVSGWLHIASGSGYSITMQVTFTYGGTSFTEYFFPHVAGSTTLPTSAALSTANFFAFTPVNVRVDPSTTIQVSTTLASGTILYEDGCTIELKK